MPDATAPVSPGLPLGERRELRRMTEIEPQSALIRFTHRIAIAAIPARRWHPAQAAVVIPEVRCVNRPVLRTLRESRHCGVALDVPRLRR